jgi:arabinan endo-1,5-alpha-L-arabinosidase
MLLLHEAAEFITVTAVRTLNLRKAKAGGSTMHSVGVAYKNPVYSGYMADPFALKHDGEYYAYGTGPADPDGKQFVRLHSKNLSDWNNTGGALQPVRDPKKTDYWAPEVCVANGKCYMFYSCGGPAGEWHQLRVAVAPTPIDTFVDMDVVLMPDEPFTIDAHPFLDPVSGEWHLFFSKDYFDGRAGTGIAVVKLRPDMMGVLGPVHTVVRATADWQIFERNRHWYGKDWDAWHTVEGATVKYDAKRKKYTCFYSGGRWENDTYGGGYAQSDSIFGNWVDDADKDGAAFLRGVKDKVIGPGHYSIVPGLDDKSEVVVYHAWDKAFTKRMMCIDPMHWDESGRPVLDGPSYEERKLRT